MRYWNWSVLAVGLTVVFVVGIAPRAAAFTESARLGGIEVTVFAPDWIWQRREVNVLFTARNTGESPATVAVTLRLPAGLEGHFTFEGEASQHLDMAPGALARGAFTGVLALDGVPCQTYDFALEVSRGEETETLAYPLKTIRGAVVGSSAAAIVLPVVIAFAFTLMFAVVLNGLAARGAWRVKGAPVSASEDRPAWIDEMPT